MFESIRRHQKVFLIVLIVLIVPSFVVVGAWDLIAPGGGANTVAKVGKQSIQFSDWERSHQQAVREVQQQFGGRVDPALIDTDAARLSTLNNLVTQQVLLVSARDFRILATDSQVQRTVASIPAVQRNGRFSMEAYQQALKAQGLTPEGFEAQIRADIAMEAMPAWLASSSVVPRSVARRLAQLSQETRTVRIKRYPVADFLANASVSEQDAKDFYQANLARFQMPEEVDIQIVAFSKPGTADKVEQFANLVYEQADTLEPAAKAAGLPVQLVKGLRRNGPSQQVPPGLASALSNPKLLEAVFSVDAIANRRNTESVELAPGVLASARVLSHRPATPIAFDSVKAEITRQLRQQKAAQSALAAAETASKSITSRQALEGLGQAKLLSRPQLKKHSTEFSAEIVSAIFSAELSKLPMPVFTSSADGSAWLGVVEAAQVPQGDSPTVREALGREFAQLERASVQDTLDRWIALQREKVGVKIYPDKVVKKANR